MSEDLSNRTTISKNIPEINSLYAYETRHKAKFTHRHQLGTGYRYVNHKAILRAKEAEIHVYHMTAEIKGVTKGLTMVTKNGNAPEVKKWFVAQINAIEKSDKLFDMFNAASYTPLELGILYLH